MNDTPSEFNMPHITDVAWCPGCGDHMLHKAIHSALHELHIRPEPLVIASGMAQAIKLSNRKLVVIVESGNGDMLSEGGNHFLNAIYRNADVTMIVHNTMVYDLTNTQASHTSQRGMKSPGELNGFKLESFNPLEVALALKAPFIARGLAGDIEQTTMMIKEAIAFKGFSVVDVCQPCVVFNKLNPCQWFKKNIHYLPKSHDTTDHNAAFRLATGSYKLPLGVFFRHEGRKPYDDPMSIDSNPLFHQQQSNEKNFQRMIETSR